MTYASYGKGGIIEDLSCMAEGCGCCASLRGLCRTHYYQLGRQVAKGKVTWDQLEAEGRILPRSTRRALAKKYRKKQNKA